MTTIGSRAGRRLPAPALGILAEDLQGALSAASRLQQRGITVEIVSSDYARTTDAQAIIVDLELAPDAAPDGAARQARVASDWLLEIGCQMIEQRVDSTLRGRPAEVLRGFQESAGLPGTVLAIVPAYPSAGRLCLDGRVVSIDQEGHAAELDVGTHLGIDPARAAVVSVAALTAGTESTLESIQLALGDGKRILIFDGTAEGHLRVAAEAVRRLAQVGRPVLTLSSGAWLRYHPDLDSDGFLVVAMAGRNQMDRRQIRSVGDVYGQSAVFLGPSDIGDSSDRHLAALISAHRIIVLQDDGPASSPSAEQAPLASAVRRLLDAGRRSTHRCLGVIVSGGVTTGSVIRALDPVSLRPGNELEPLSPVVRLTGGPFSRVPVISKASGVGTEETMVRLVRRIIGT